MKRDLSLQDKSRVGAAIMARFMGQIAVCNVLIPRTETIAAEVYAQLPRNNFIDELVWRNLQRLNITPSPVCDDHTFLRRATTDICGRIPDPAEVTAFLADLASDKRAAGGSLVAGTQFR